MDDFNTSQHESCTIYLLSINDIPYVGQTRNFDNRKSQHLRSLKKGRHFNKSLQVAYNKYGVESVEFSVLARCDEDSVNNLELEWIIKYDSFANGFNNDKGGKRVYKAPCEWNGVLYPSVSSAAEALGIKRVTMEARYLKGQKSDKDLGKWTRRTENPKPRPPKANPKAIIWNGIRYPDITEASEALGVTKTAVRTRLKKGYTSDGDLKHHRPRHYPKLPK